MRIRWWWPSVHPERAQFLRERYGVATPTNTDAVKSADILVLAVKPQDMGALLTEIGGDVRTDQLVVSVAAGIPTSFIERHVGPDVPVVRVMSNTAVLVDAAMSAISPGSHAGPEHPAVGREPAHPGR